MPRINFIQVQKGLWKDTPHLAAETLVDNFRRHYNLASFASSISRFKSELRTAGAPEEYVALLRPTAEETAEVQATNRRRLDLKCRQSITLKNCGDNMIMYFRQCLESNELGKLMMGIQACTGLRMVEAVCRAEIDTPMLTHETDDIYWAYVKGICKKQNNDFSGHERPLLHRRDHIQAALGRLRKEHFADLQQCDDNKAVSRKACTKINRSIRKCWPYPEVKRVTSHFFRSFYVASTFHYMNKNSSINMWASDVLCHESMSASFPYTGLLITGFGSLCFDVDRQLQGMARLRV